MQNLFLPKIFSSILACKNAQPYNYITVEVAAELYLY